MAGKSRRIELMSSEPLNPIKKKKKTFSIRFKLDLSTLTGTYEYDHDGNYSEISYLELLKKSEVGNYIS